MKKELLLWVYFYGKNVSDFYLKDLSTQDLRDKYLSKSFYKKQLEMNKELLIEDIRQYFENEKDLIDFIENHMWILESELKDTFKKKLIELHNEICDCVKRMNCTNCEEDCTLSCIENYNF